jgi:glucosylglycerate synthase
MLAGFRLGVRDLLTVWERILAPENLAEILDLSDAGIEEFRLPDHLWARVVYDFLLGYRFRVVYRTHLAQSLAPLYLGRVASVMLETRGRPPAAVAESADRLAERFEREKGYVVERWA